ncbi:MAG: hypothetical protein JO068_10875 [Hyphomicrobiales bacterium]|nr:hypothetical protein [Hyphomicrobiales bacterium]
MRSHQPAIFIEYSSSPLGLNTHVLRLACAGLGALALGACQQAGTNGTIQAALPDVPPEFNTTVRTPSPDPGKWVYQKVNDRDQWRCRPLSCPDNSVVTIAITKSPTPRPDPIALDKYVKTEAPKANEKFNASLPNAQGLRESKFVSASVEKFRGYYAIRSIFDMLSDKGPYERVEFLVFAGGSLVRIESAAMTLPTARKNLDDFVMAMQIEGHSPE